MKCGEFVNVPGERKREEVGGVDRGVERGALAGK
jgi:hypothetical protein